MAKLKEAAQVEAAVLRDCGFGKVGEIVLLSESDCRIGCEHGMLDANKEAIQHIKSNTTEGNK